MDGDSTSSGIKSILEQKKWLALVPLVVLVLGAISFIGINGYQNAIADETGGEWALVDLGDVVVHIMMPAIREFYQIEKLWSVASPRAADGEP